MKNTKARLVAATLGILGVTGAAPVTVWSQNPTQAWDLGTPSANSEPERVYVVPGVAHAQGLGDTFWMTDLSVLNTGAGTVDLELAFNGSTPAAAVTMILGPRAQLHLADVLTSAFAIDGETVGVVTVTSSDVVEVTARSYTQATDPCTGEPTSYGLSYLGMTADEALPGTRLGYLSGLRSDGVFRTNLELANAGEVRATVEVRFFDGDGAAIGQPVIRQVGPGRRVGVTSALPPGHQSAYAELRLSPPEARVIAFASVIDGVSGDPVMVAVTHGPFRSDLASVAAGSLDGQWLISDELIEAGSQSTVCGYDTGEPFFRAYDAGGAVQVSHDDGSVEICFDVMYFGCHRGYVEGSRVTASVENTYIDSESCGFELTSHRESTFEAAVVDGDRIEGTARVRWTYSGGGRTMTNSSTWSVVLTR